MNIAAKWATNLLGQHNAKTWLNSWLVEGTNCPLLFDRVMKLKSGFLEGLSSANPND